MARFARVVLPGCAYHVTHRGNRGNPVFLTDCDRGRYLDYLREYSSRHRLDVWAYCLMTNHVHLIVVGHEWESLARAIGHAHRRHAQAVNRDRGWTGHLWANRFYSTPLDEGHLWAAVRYVELNPVRAGNVGSAIDYRWSSARAHAGLGADPLLAPGRPFPGRIQDWVRWLAEGVQPEVCQRIRKNTATGRPSGSAEFTIWLENQLSRGLRTSKPGPKPRHEG